MVLLDDPEHALAAEAPALSLSLGLLDTAASFLDRHACEDQAGRHVAPASVGAEFGHVSPRLTLSFLFRCRATACEGLRLQRGGWLQLVVAGALTLGLTSIVAMFIRSSLFGVLQMICGTEVSARFWTTFSLVLLVMGPLFLVFTAAGGAESLADFVRRTVYLVSFGVIAAFLAMGAAVMLSAPSQALARHRVAQITQDGLVPPVTN